MPRTAPPDDAPAGAGSASSGPPRWLRPVAYVLLGAVVALGAYALVDGLSSSDSSRAAAPTTTSTTTTLAPAVAAKVYRTIQPSLVVLRASGGAEGETSLGSGVIVNKQAEIMTANHVIEGATSVEVMFADGSRATRASSPRPPNVTSRCSRPTSRPG